MQTIPYCAKQWLIFRSFSTQGVEPDLLFFNIYFAPDQTMQPVRTYCKAMSKQAHFSPLAGSSNVDDSSPHFLSWVESPLFRELSSLRSFLYSCCIPHSASGHISARLLADLPQRVIVKSTPNFLLPTSIKTLYCILKALLVRRSKDRHYRKIQTELGDCANRIRILMRTLKADVIVELRIIRQSPLLPVLRDRFFNCLSRKILAREAFLQAAMQSHDIEDTESCSTFKEQIFDKITVVNLSANVSNIFQVPALGWGKAAYSPLRINHPIALKDITNRAKRGYSTQSTSLHLAPDSYSPKLTQRTLFFEFAPYRQDLLLDFRARAIMNVIGRARSISKANAIKAFALGPLNPTSNSRLGDLKSLCNRTYRMTPTEHSNHLAAMFFDTIFLFTVSTFLCQFSIMLLTWRRLHLLSM